MTAIDTTHTETIVHATRDATQESNENTPMKARRKTAHNARTSKRTSNSKAGRKSAKKTTSAKPTSVLATLSHEHQHVERLLDAIQEQVACIDTDQETDFALLQDMLHYLYSYPDKFHHPREDIVFQRLIELDRRYLGYVKELEAEHRDMHADCGLLLKKITSVCEDETCENPQYLKVQLQDYIDFYRMHMNLEESKVFPAIRKTFSEEDWQWVTQQSKKQARQQADPLFGDSLQTRYQDVSDYIETLERDNDQQIISSRTAWMPLSRFFSLAGSSSREINRIISQRSKIGWNGNKQALLRALDREQDDRLSDLPLLLMRRNMMQCSEGFNDVKAVLKATGKSLLDPSSDKKTGAAFKRAV